MVRLTRAIEFATSLRYALPGQSEAASRERFGDRARQHGHNYRLEVTVRGEVDPVTGMVVDLKVIPGRETSVDEVNKAMEHAAAQELKGILGVTSEPLVSTDFNHNPMSATFDLTHGSVRKISPKALSCCDSNFLLHEFWW